MADGVIGKPISVSILVLTEASGKCGYITGIKSNDSVYRVDVSTVGGYNQFIWNEPIVIFHS